MWKRWIVPVCVLLLVVVACLAQSPQAAPASQSSADTTADTDEPDAPVAKAGEGAAELGTAGAWQMLKDALADSKTQTRPARLDAVAALGTLSDFEPAQKWLRDAAADPERYLRLAA